MRLVSGWIHPDYFLPSAGQVRLIEKRGGGRGDDLSSRKMGGRGRGEERKGSGRATDAACIIAVHVPPEGREH